MGWNTHGVAGPLGQGEISCTTACLGGRGPSSPNGPNSPLRGSESAEIGAPHDADPGARGAGAASGAGVGRDSFGATGQSVMAVAGDCVFW
eukprot:5042349-Alexandrium_andersonii.AAC.1